MAEVPQSNNSIVNSTSQNINVNAQNKVQETNLINIDNNTSHIKSQNSGQNKLPKLCWIDYNIANKENMKYKKELYPLVKLIECKEIEQGLEEIKKIKFEKVMIMLSKSMFEKFISKFEKERSNICCTLNIIVFTKKKNKSDIEKICNNNKEISSGYLFNKINIFSKISEIKEFIIKVKEGKINYSTHLEIIDDNNKIYYDEKMDAFIKIENFEELILPLYFHKLIEPITLEDIHNFNYYLSTSIKETKDLISQFENIAEMPIEIICKYWAKIYTLDKGNFYAILNNALREKKFKFFLPFIKMMYEGVKRKVFISVTNVKLYSGGLISNLELQKLRDNLNDNENSINEIPKMIHYFKAFKSFSKKKEQAEKFINKAKKNKNENATLIMFIINESNIEEEFISNAYIKEYSAYKKEDEVLFFPFSSFEIENIEDENDHVNIYLKYLGKYRPYIEGKKVNLFRDLPINQFGKDINEMGLIKYKFMKFWEVEKQISLNNNATCIIPLKNDLILFSIKNLLKVYDLKNDKAIKDINIHKKEINDLLKINEYIFASSSKDNTIQFIQFTADYKNYVLLKNIQIHSDEVNQTIKLEQNNLYLSCSEDKTFKFFEFDLNNTENNVIEKKSISYIYPFISIYELPNTNILTISLDGYLKFWEYKNLDCNLLGSLKGFKNSLHNCITLIKESIALIGTKNKVIFVDVLKKQKIKKFMLEYNAYSICNIRGNIFLGLKNSKNSCLLYEYNFSKENEEINFECIGKGRDICSKIAFINELDENRIITCNKNNYIKIWKETENKPKFLLFENNQDYNFQDDYESENDNIIITPKGEGNNTIKKENETPENINTIQNSKKGERDFGFPHHSRIGFGGRHVVEFDRFDSFIENSGINLFNNNNNNNNSENINKEKENEFSLLNNNINNKDNNSEKINIIFDLQTGLKITILCNKEGTIEDLIKLFFDKVYFRYDESNESIVFMYNTKKLKYKDKTKIKDIFFNNYEHITVYDNDYSLMNNLITLKTFKGEEYKISSKNDENMHSLLKTYFEKIGKPEEINKYEGLKDIAFEDFLVKLSNYNQ